MRVKCRVRAVPYSNLLSKSGCVKSLIQDECAVTRCDASKIRRSFLRGFITRPWGVRYKWGMNSSSQEGKIATNLLHSSLFIVASTFARLFVMEEWLP